MIVSVVKTEKGIRLVDSDGRLRATFEQNECSIYVYSDESGQIDTGGTMYGNLYDKDWISFVTYINTKYNIDLTEYKPEWVGVI